MADARALLRAHRAENRIKHPHAAYSDAGKLLCKLCHDTVKADSLWDSHVRSLPHRQKLQTLQQPPQQPSPPFQSTEETQKRKRGEDEDDEHMVDGEDENDTIPAKRSRTDGVASQTSGNAGESSKEKTQTPPGLARRTSGTPVHGVEIAIPSRPATPLAGSNSTVSTPKAISMTKSPLAGSERSSISGASITAATSIPISTDTLDIPSQNTMQAPSSRNAISATAQKPSGAVDEAEWAAFEAEMSVLDAPEPPAVNGANRNPYADATISAPALSAAQVAAKSEEEEHERRKHALEAEIADEREDATRALEEEFEEMEELESRVRRLKERREELRKGSVMNLRGAAAAEGKENLLRNGDLAENHEEDDDDDDDEDEWDGFRFRA